MVSKLLCAVFFSLIIFSGCSIKDTVKNGSDEEILRDRVMTFWHHKINKEFDKSYEYEDPLYKKKITMGNYIGSFHTTGAKLKWLAASIENVKLDDDSATVNMKLMVKVIASPSQNVEQEVPLKETWVKVDGQWFHVEKKTGNIN